MNLSISSWNGMSFWFMYFEAVLLGEEILRIAMILWFMDSFIIKKWPSLSSDIGFAVKFTFSDINVVRADFLS